jgi:hypothetical protein
MGTTLWAGKRWEEFRTEFDFKSNRHRARHLWIDGRINEKKTTKFPSISNWIFRSITHNSTNRSVRGPWNDGKCFLFVNFSSQQTNKEICRCQLQFVIRPRIYKLLAYFNVKMSSNPIIWLIEQRRAYNDASYQTLKNKKKYVESKLIQFGRLSWWPNWWT